MRAARLIDADSVHRLLPMQACIDALDRALAAAAREPVPSFVGAVKAPAGKFHLKSALSAGARPMFAAKINANFPDNPAQGRPTIQGVLVLFDATSGEPLATMDSGAVTAIRTAAATAVAVRHLAPVEANELAIIGCGAQGWHHVEALAAVRPLQRVRLHDRDRSRAEVLRARVERDLGIPAEACADLSTCTREAPLVVTLTSSRQPFLGVDHVRADAFVGAVGVDSPDKSEIMPDLMRASRVVVDDPAQCAVMGDLRHAIAAGALGPGDVWATLAEVAADPARHRPGGRVIFDSTGIPIEDVVAATIVFESLT